ncbi:MAG: hypothetical protein JWN32_767 [Solirubrobacterales bacterium]|nr:hypothetical protein [Solirubrobacterales bacterium]
MRRAPPLLWLPVYVASELILLGSHRRWGMLVTGLVLAVLALVVALRWALARRDDRPRPRWFLWVVLGVASYYVIAAAAAYFVGPAYAVAALLAGIIPRAAVAVVLATVRSTTVEHDGRRRDTAGDSRDPLPGIGLDDETPLGDTSEHSEDIHERDAQRSR